MLETRVIPCLLVNNERLVKTVRFKRPAYVGDPINAIKIYNEKEVDELIILDITATTEQRQPSLKLLSEITSECFMPLCYGGGVRNVEDMRQVFDMGVEKIAINSYAFENPKFIRQVSELFGSQSIVFSMDVKKSFFGKYCACSYGGKKVSKKDPVKFAMMMEKMGAGEIFLNCIDRDGTWEGYDIDLISAITKSVNLPVIACGGAGKIEDFGKAVRDGGAAAVAAGSMVVYQGKDLGVLINFPSRKELKRVLG